MEAASIPHHLILLPEHLSASERNCHNSKTNFNLGNLKNPILARLEQCTSMRHLRQLHAQMITTGLVHETFAASRLIAFCGLSLHGDLRYALKLFPQVRGRNLFLWNLMIRAFSRSNHPELSLRFYVQMLESGGCAPDSYTFPFLLKSCSHMAAAEEEGRQVHAHLVKTGLEADPFVSNSLLYMYSESGCLEMAKTVFLRMSGTVDGRGQVSLATMLGGLIGNGCPEEAIALFCSNDWRQSSLDQITLATVLSACARVQNLKLGKEIHCYIEEQGPEMGLVVCNSLINMYAKCGELGTSRTLFERMPIKDSVSWNVMISGLAENGYLEEGLELLSEMRLKRNVSADQATFLSLVSSCDRLCFAKRIHGQIVDMGFDSNIPICNALIDTYSQIGHAELAKHVFEGMQERDVITWNSMIGGYARCGSMEAARSLFCRMPVKDNVSWSTMILGYVRNGQPKEAISVYRELRTEGFIEPDNITMVSVLTACSSLGALEEGKAIHDYIQSNDIELDNPLATTLIDMYSKCGCPARALEVFQGTASEKDVLTWTAMISGFSTNGDAEGALRLFRAMTAKPNPVTFLAVLTACAHAGLVEEGNSIYSSMIGEHKLEPEMAHLGCMVDLLGRAGRLDEALEFIVRCGYEVVDVTVWGALLGACKIHGDVELGELAARKMIELEPTHRGAHVLMSNMYAEAGQWDERKVVRRKMREESLVKEVGMSWIEVGGTLQEFAAGNFHCADG
ncbi:pentatricopeptide repeat-containing protein [Iris pallida]|uniref:Pentatricopeptide repeat-containing protein n=1 Tax=Iris pallida TaxID=29817 RepID=A0AAX6FST1_IRIPA|nr:pentatricopeptide repeat-containing protein [Iris pallida]